VAHSISLNARAVAKYMTVGESAQRTTIRQYAQPKKFQMAAVLMYDTIRKSVREYFKSGRDPNVLDRLRAVIEQEPAKNKQAQDRERANLRALRNLQDLNLGGTLVDVDRYRGAILVSGLPVKATIDFTATFRPANLRSRERRVAVILNPSGIQRGNPASYKRFGRIECEFALRMLKSDKVTADECWYVDLPRQAIVEKYGRCSDRLWTDIDAACERVVEDFKRYRLQRRERHSDESA
jgi:hypothetical protein